jgi:acetoin utilization protein AcuB
MEVARWMKHPVHFVKPLDTIAHARALLEEHRINQLPVVVNGRVIGIITDRDLRDAFPSVFDAGRGVSKTKPDAIPVESVMSPNVLTIEPGAGIRDAVQLMRRERIGAIPVVDGDRLVGILTRSDVLDAFVALVR